MNVAGIVGMLYTLRESYLPKQEGQHVKIPAVKLIVQAASTDNTYEVGCEDNAQHGLYSHPGDASYLPTLLAETCFRVITHHQPILASQTMPQQGILIQAF